MSDGDNSDFLDDPKAYEDEQSDVFSGLSRRGSESYNQPPEELNLRKQDSGAKNPNMVVDLKTRLRKNTSESSEPMRTYQDIPVPPPPMYNPPLSHMPPQHPVEHSGKPVVEIGMRLKSIYPQRYFIFKNMKPQHFKFCRENNYGITQKTNENTLKSAFENSENLLIIFSNTEQRSFLGYARMESDYFDAPEMIDNFTKNSGLTRVDFDNNFIFRIEWKSKNTVRYEFVSHIKNKYNENREVNHSKVFQEVDPNAGKALIALLENPPTEPIAEHEPPEHKRDEQPPMPFHKAPKQEGNFPPNNFMMNNPMMPPHFGYYPMNPMNPMGGQMGGMGMGPMGGQPGMFPMPGQPGMMPGMPKQFPYNMNYNDYYMNMQQQQQQQQQQMMKQNKDKGRKKSASSSGSSSRSSSGSSRSSSPKKGSAKGGRRDSKSASRSRSKSHKRQNKMEKRGGNNTYQKDYQKDYQKGGRKYDHNNPNPNYPNQNRNKFDKFNKFDKNNNYNNNKNPNYRGGNNNPHNRRRNSRSGSPNNRNNNNKNRFNNRNQRRSHSRSEEDRRRHTPEDQHKEENFESQQQPPERETHHQETQSPVVQRERSLSNHNDLEDPFDFGEIEDRISEGGNDRKVEEERQDSPHAFDEDIRPGKRRSNSRSNKRSGSASSSKSVTESKSTTTKNQDIDFRPDNQRKKKFSRDDEPLVITKGNNKIIGGKGNTERLIIGKPNKHSKGRSPDRSERYERHDRHDRYDRHRNNDRNDRRRSSRERDTRDNRDNRDHRDNRNASNRKSRERDASRDRRDSNRDRRETQRDRREDRRDEQPRERRDEGYDSKPKETPRREREPERSVESSETKGKRIDLRERLTQKDSLAAGAGSITNRIIKKN